MNAIKKSCLLSLSVLVGLTGVLGGAGRAGNAFEAMNINRGPKMAGFPTGSDVLPSKFNDVKELTAGFTKLVGGINFNNALEKLPDSDGYSLYHIKLASGYMMGADVNASGSMFLDTANGYFTAPDSEDEESQYTELYISTINYPTGTIGFNSVTAVGDIHVYLSTYSGYTYAGAIHDGGSKDLYYSVDAKTTQASIVAGVSAVDLFGAACTIVVKSSDYVVGTVGTYTIVLTATDSYGNTATATLIVHVVDRTSPVVTKKTDVSCRYGNKLSVADVLGHYTITDNIDTAFTYGWTLPNNFKFDTALAYGTYSLGLSVKDSAGNETKVTISVNVFDDVPPTITRADGSADGVLTYGYSKTNGLTVAKILALFKATDIVSGASTVYLKTGTLDLSIGDHSLVIAAKDTVGNEAVKTVNYHIQADIPPVFILSSSLIQVENDIKLTVNDLTSIVENVSGGTTAGLRHALKADASVASKGIANIKINEDDFAAYLQCWDKAGKTLAIRYSYDDAKGEVQNGTLNVKIVEAVDEGDQRNGWDKFCDGFVKFFTVQIPEFFQRLKNWFCFDGWKTDAEVKADKAAEETEEKTSGEKTSETSSLAPAASSAKEGE